MHIQIYSSLGGVYMNKKSFVVTVSVFSAFIMLLSFCFLPLFVSGNEDTGYAIEQESVSVTNFGKSIPTNAARCAVVIDADTKNTLFESNADEARGMASTTKIMTALLAIENGGLDDEFVIPDEAVGIEGSSVYLKSGESLTLRELLYCLMLESGNDAATAIAIRVSGSVDEFVKAMNGRASEMGLTSTAFANPHGLSDEDHKTTARELAYITAEAMQYPLFREITATKSFSVRYNGIKDGRRLVNHNKLLFGYEGANGVKTGYTKLDGRCLVSSATRDSMTVIAVTLSDPFPSATHRSLLDAAFENYEQRQIIRSGEIDIDIPIKNGEAEFINATNTQSVSLCLPKGAEITAELVIKDDISAPIDRCEIIGQTIFRYNGEVVYIINIETTESVAGKKKSIFEMIFGK